MNESLSKKRWAENEVIFRDTNQKVPEDLTELKQAAEEEGHQDLVQDIKTTQISFYCECSDEKCRDRIMLTADEYLALHRTKKQFLMLPGHDIPTVENIIATTNEYIIVEKKEDPPETPNKTLNPTNLNNG
jgi:hypothetical protein